MGTASLLTTCQLNRAVLARQLLLERSTASIPRVLERMGGLQAQYAPAIYQGLWSRVAGLDRSRVTTSLEKRQVVQATMMRGTIHAVSAGDYWPMTLAVRDDRRNWFLQVYRGPATKADFEQAATVIKGVLASGPETRTELSKVIGPDLWSGVGMFVDLVRVPPSGTWERRRADLFGLAELWVPDAGAEPSEALELLVRRYLTGFGPAAATDIGLWAGIPTDRLLPVLDRMDLRQFSAEDGKVLHDLKRAPLPDPGLIPPVRFLPVWDTLLLVHARRKAVIAEEHRPIIFNSQTPQSMPTFMVDGAVAGTWKYQEGRVALVPFAPIPKKWKRELEDEAAALAAFHR